MLNSFHNRFKAVVESLEFLSQLMQFLVTKSPPRQLYRSNKLGGYLQKWYRTRLQVYKRNQITL